MIRDEICTYEVAKLAKEKGFNIHCTPFYALDNFTAEYVDDAGDFYEVDFEKGDLYLNYPIKGSLHKAKMLPAPTQSLLQRWLREEKGIVILINIGYCYENKDTPFYENPNMEPIFNGYYYGIWRLDDLNDKLGRSNYFPTYELALENALSYALKNLV